MTLKQAIKLLTEEYNRALHLEYVHNPLAYALYKVWKMADTDTHVIAKKVKENKDV